MQLDQHQGKEKRLVDEYMDALNDHYCALISDDHNQIMIAKARIDDVIGKMARIDVDEISYESNPQFNAAFNSIFKEQRA